MELFFFWLIMAAVVALVASAKGRSGGLWFVYGLVIWPIALIHAVVITKDVAAIEKEKQKEGKMRCPNCADWVYKEAKTCPHCQYQLKGKSQVQPDALSKAVRESVIIEDEEEFWEGDRNLQAARYKIYLSEKYDIQKNELFGKFVCLDEMFDTIDEAVAKADQVDQERELAFLEAEKNKADSVVNRGVIGPRSAFSYEEFASGEVIASHPSGLSKTFKNQRQAEAFFKKCFSESDALFVMKNETKPN